MRLMRWATDTTSCKIGPVAYRRIVGTANLAVRQLAKLEVPYRPYIGMCALKQAILPFMWKHFIHPFMRTTAT
jgi:hypothetical protein